MCHGCSCLSCTTAGGMAPGVQKLQLKMLVQPQLLIVFLFSRLCSLLQSPKPAQTFRRHVFGSNGGAGCWHAAHGGGGP